MRMKSTSKPKAALLNIIVMNKTNILCLMMLEATTYRRSQYKMPDLQIKKNDFFLYSESTYPAASSYQLKNRYAGHLNPLIL